MPNAINNTDLTDGVYVQNPLKSLSCFFLESGKTFAQEELDTFGPKDSNKFRTSSTIHFTDTAEVYAICSGTILIQPQLDDAGVPTDLVNVIIRPTIQPIIGLSIKYFIYRGLNKSDFVNIDGNILGTGEGTEFTDKLNTGFYGLLPDDVEFKSKYIGYPSSADDVSQFPDDMLIEDLVKNRSTFYNEVDDEVQEDPSKRFQLAPVSIGEHIGSASWELSIDIVLEEIDTMSMNGQAQPFHFDLKFLRSSFHEFDLTFGGYTGFEKKLIREASCQFIDLAAYIGSHCNGEGGMYFDGIESEATYDEIIDKLNFFETKNTVYLTILSHRGRTYNYYGQHFPEDGIVESIKIGFDENDGDGNDFIPKEFGTFGWPLEVLNYDDNPNDYNELKLQLYAKSKFKCYCQVGEFISSSENRFIVQENQDSGFTETISLKLIEDDFNALSQQVILIYEDGLLKLADEFEKGGVLFDLTTYLTEIQNVFQIGSIAPTFHDKVYSEMVNRLENTIYSRYSFIELSGEQLIQRSKLIREYHQMSGTVIGRTMIEGASFDSISFGAKRKTFNELGGDFNISLTFEGNSNFYQPSGNLQLDFGEFQFDGTTIDIMSVRQSDGELYNGCFIGLATTEEDDILEEIEINGIKNATLFLEEKDGLGTFTVNGQDVKLTRFLVHVVGETESDILHLHRLSDSISVYSVDGRYFFSQKFSQTTRFLSLIDEVDISDLSISQNFQIVPVIVDPPDPSTILTDSQGAVLKSGRVVTTEPFQSFKLDSDGFLVSFVYLDGNEYRRFHEDEIWDKDSEVYSPLVLRNEEGDFLNVQEVINVPRTVFANLSPFRFYDMDIGEVITLTKIDFDDYSEDYLPIKRFSIGPLDGEMVKSHNFVDENGQIREDLITELESNLAVDLDTNAEFFKDRQKVASYFTSLEDNDKKIFYKEIALIAIEMTTFYRETRPLILAGESSLELEELIDDLLLNWHDSLILDTLDKLREYRNDIESFNREVFKDQMAFQIFKPDEKITRLYGIRPFVENVTTLEGKKEILKEFTKRDSLSSHEQFSILRILEASIDEPDEANELLDFLLEILDGSSNTIFSLLSERMEEREWFDDLDNIHYPPVFILQLGAMADGETRQIPSTNRLVFIGYIYQLWSISKYSPIDFSTGEMIVKPEEDYYFATEEGLVYAENSRPWMYFQTNYSGEKEATLFDYVPELAQKGVKVYFNEVKKVYRYKTTTEFQGGFVYSEETNLEIDHAAGYSKPYSSYHLYQPIHAIGYTTDWELGLDQHVSIYPAFLHHYARTFENVKKHIALVWLGINIVFEVILFAVTGGASGIKNFRYLIRLGAPGRSLFHLTASTFTWTTVTTVAEITGAVLYNYADYIANSTPDLATKNFYRKLSYWFMGISGLSGMISGGMFAYLNKASKEVLAAYNLLSDIQKNSSGLTSEMIYFMNQFAEVDVLPFKAYLTDNGLGVLKTTLDTLSGPQYVSFYLDFHYVRFANTTDYLKMQSNLNSVGNWWILKGKGVPEMNLPAVIVDDLLSAKFSRIFDEIDLKNNILDLTSEARIRFADGFGGLSDPLFAILVSRPDKVADYALSYLTNSKKIRKLQNRINRAVYFYLKCDYNSHQIDYISKALEDGYAKVFKRSNVLFFVNDGLKAQAIEDFLEDGRKWSKGDIVEKAAIEGLSRSAPENEKIWGAVRIEFNYGRNTVKGQQHEIDGLRFNTETGKIEQIISVKFSSGHEFMKDKNKLIELMLNLPNGGQSLKDFVGTHIFKIEDVPENTKIDNLKKIDRIEDASIVYFDPILKRDVEISPSVFRNYIKDDYSLSDFLKIEAETMPGTNKVDLMDASYEYFKGRIVE